MKSVHQHNIYKMNFHVSVLALMIMTDINFGAFVYFSKILDGL